MRVNKHLFRNYDSRELTFMRRAYPDVYDGGGSTLPWASRCQRLQKLLEGGEGHRLLKPFSLSKKKVLRNADNT